MTASTSTMRAAFVREYGPADAIETGQLPRPRPAASEVLVAVDTVAVNPVDTFVRSGSYRTAVPMPLIVGRDLVGTVAAVGSSVPAFTVGDRVWCNSMGHDGRQGATSEFVAVPADRLYPVPDDVRPQQLVALAHPAATAYLGWFVHAQLTSGQRVFVGGGGGNVGSAAITLAKQAGAHVIASARAADADRCTSAGADVVVDYRDRGLAARIRDFAPEGVDAYWETSGHHDFDLVSAVVAPGATVLVTAASEPSSVVPLPRLYTSDVRLVGFVISRAGVSDLRAASEVINRLAGDGSLTARIAAVLPLSRTAEAHRRVEAGSVHGRLLIDVRG